MLREGLMCLLLKDTCVCVCERERGRGDIWREMREWIKYIRYGVYTTIYRIKKLLIKKRVRQIIILFMITFGLFINFE